MNRVLLYNNWNIVGLVYIMKINVIEKKNSDYEKRKTLNPRKTSAYIHGFVLKEALNSFL